MTFEKAFIYEKIETIEKYLREVTDLLSLSDKDILSDYTKLHTAERLLQLIVDAMIDINQHIIKEKNLKIIEDLQGTFYVLGDNAILPQDFVNKIAPVVAVRNRIVHGYETVDKNLLVVNLRKNYSDFEKYIKLIDKYLK